MNNSPTFELYLFLSIFIPFIGLIVLFVVASRSGAIRKTLDEIKYMNADSNYVRIFELGEIKEHQGKTQEALDFYVEAYYRLSKLKYKGSAEENNAETMRSKISSLGGTLKTMN